MRTLPPCWVVLTIAIGVPKSVTSSRRRSAGAKEVDDHPIALFADIHARIRVGQVDQDPTFTFGAAPEVHGTQRALPARRSGRSPGWRRRRRIGSPEGGGFHEPTQRNLDRAAADRDRVIQ